jgi:hypothetical protein
MVSSPPRGQRVAAIARPPLIVTIENKVLAVVAAACCAQAP